jgi:hypothetical protein
MEFLKIGFGLGEAKQAFFEVNQKKKLAVC